VTPDKLDLPVWACASAGRRNHIARVVTLLEEWGKDLALSGDELSAWVDAGRYHDALRDATPAELRLLVSDAAIPDAVLHGVAAAARLEREGEARASVLEAVRSHTTGSAAWDRTGKALFMADYLDSARPFDRERRALLAARVVNDFDGVFRQVVRARIEWALHEGHSLYPQTVELWNSLA
jgi:HD superfamily phosphohydrolase YqeK